MRKYFCWLLCVMLLSFYISDNWYQLLLVRGESMSPAYNNMQLAVLDRHSGCYTYGDVIAFRCDSLEALLVKRIAACPGDDVVINDGLLFVNGSVSEVFSSDYMFEYAGIAVETLRLGEGQYFVIGDNVAHSRDSRYESVGLVSMNDILGEIVLPRN